MKLAVFCVVAVSVASLTTMLIEGCKRETENPPVDTNTETSVDTNQTPLVDTNNPPVVVPPISTNPTPAVVVPPVAPPAPETQPAETESTYVVKAGDTLGKIAKANGVSLKALEAANSDVQPTRLKVGQKLNLPASTGGSTASTEPGLERHEQRRDVHREIRRHVEQDCPQPRHDGQGAESRKQSVLDQDQSGRKVEAPGERRGGKPVGSAGSRSDAGASDPATGGADGHARARRERTINLSTAAGICLKH